MRRSSRSRPSVRGSPFRPRWAVGRWTGGTRFRRRGSVPFVDSAADRTFRVDLRGVVDLLSHHLYASPRVYVRELLQNAVDAITARGAGGPAQVRIDPPERTGDGTLRIADTGIGLTEEQVHEFLATIGRS